MKERASSSMGHRIIFLDALRFIAAAAVVFQHVIELEGPWGKAIVATLSPGVFGVVLFFIISGFVIPLAAKNHLNLRKFIIRRMFRIYPLVIVTFLMLSLIIYGNFFPTAYYGFIPTIFDWFANILLIQDYVGANTLWGVTWTLNLEVAWYTLFALSMILIGNRFDKSLSIYTPILFLGLVFLSLSMEQRLPLGRLGMIYAAILGCRIYRNQTGVVSDRRIIFDILIFICVMAVSNIVCFGYFKHPNITMNQALYPWIAAPILFSIVALLPTVRNLCLVNSTLIGWLGKISFSTYLLHPFAIQFAENFVPAKGTFILSVVLTLLLSALGFYLVELPGQRLGRWVEDSLGKFRGH